MLAKASRICYCMIVANIFANVKQKFELLYKEGKFIQTQALAVFENPEFKDVRIVYRGRNPWFCGKDVCKLFGDRNHNRSLSRVSDDDKEQFEVDTKGGKQKVTFVNESGLYTLLLGMQPQKANTKGIPNAYSHHVQERLEKLSQFRRWVTHEVLPTVRQSGEYVTPALTQQREAFITQVLEDYHRRKRHEGGGFEI